MTIRQPVRTKRTDLPVDLGRVCAECGVPIIRRARDQRTKFLYCGRTCSWNGMRKTKACAKCGRRKKRDVRHVCPKPYVPKPVKIKPSSHRVASWASLTTRCPWCLGPWKAIMGGVACQHCGRDVYVVQDLARIEARSMPGPALKAAAS